MSESLTEVAVEIYETAISAGFDAVSAMSISSEMMLDLEFYEAFTEQ